MAQLVAVALVLLCLAGGALLWSRQWAPDASEFPDQGFELSEAEGQVNWVAARDEGATFVYLDATWGTESRAQRFAEDWVATRAAGLRRGAVHRFDLCRLATDQAASFIATMPREPDSLPPALSVDADEDCTSRPSRSVLLQELALFIRMVEAHAGKPLILRLSRDIEAEYQLSRALDRPLWLSGFFLMPTYGERPWVMWEANASRSIRGVDHPVRWLVLRP